MNKPITPNDLRQMRRQEGLILMGCGGSLDEWETGVNDWLTEEGILKDGTRFTDVSPFQHRGLTCLLFAFTEDVKLELGRLAFWRIRTKPVFGSTWLSDFLDNQFGMAESAAPPRPMRGKRKRSGLTLSRKPSRSQSPKQAPIPRRR